MRDDYDMDVKVSVSTATHSPPPSIHSIQSQNNGNSYPHHPNLEMFEDGRIEEDGGELTQRRSFEFITKENMIKDDNDHSGVERFSSSPQLSHLYQHHLLSPSSSYHTTPSIKEEVEEEEEGG